MSHELAAAGFGALMAGVILASTRAFGDQVYQSKSASVRTAVVAAVAAGAAYYYVGGPAV